MTVQKLYVKNLYDGDGNNTQWPITFEWKKEHPESIKVYTRINGVLNKTTNFKLQQIPSTEEYEVLYPVAGEPLAAGDKIIIVRELTLHQVLNLVNQGPFFAEDVEITFDEVVMMIQQLNETLGRSLKVGVDIDSEKDIDVTIPVPADESNYGIRITKKGFELVNDPSSVYDETVAEREMAEAARDISVAAKNVAVESIEGYEQARVVLDNIDNYRQQANASAALAREKAEVATIKAREANIDADNAAVYSLEAKRYRDSASAIVTPNGLASKVNQNTDDISMQEKSVNYCVELITEKGEELTFPSDYNGFADFTEINEDVITGTRNIWSLISKYLLPDGVYEKDGLTVTVSENSQCYEFIGTVTATTYFNLGTGFTGSYLTHLFDYPKGTFVLAGFNVGSKEMPAQGCNIRAISGGNFTVTSRYVGDATYDGYSAASPITITDDNQSNLGQLYFYFNANSTVNFKAKMCLFANCTSHIDARYNGGERISKNTIIRQHGIKYITGYTWSNSIVKANAVVPLQNKADEKKNYISWNNQNQSIDIFIPSKIGYVAYPLRHEVLGGDVNADAWRIYTAYAADDTLNKRYNITNEGEWECAIRIANRSDFMGGTNHGDEITNTIAFWLDGARVNAEEIPNTTFNTFEVMTTSTLYDPADHTTQVATHIKKYTFTGKGLNLKQKVIFLHDEQMTNSYLCMMPVKRHLEGTSGTLITDHAYANDEYIEYDCSVANGNNKMHSWRKGVTACNTYGVDSGISVTTRQIKQIPADLNRGGYFEVSNAAQYNKHYYSICGIGGQSYEPFWADVKVGDVWETEYEYEIKIGK